MAALRQLSRSFIFLFSVGLMHASFARPAQAEAKRIKVPTRNFVSSLPLMHIDTSGLEIPDDGEVKAKVSILEGTSNRSADLRGLAPRLAGFIEIRGNSSAKWAKKQYDLQLFDPRDPKRDAPVSLLGLPAHHRWVLAAPYSDRALIRNALAFEVARGLKGPSGKSWYAPRTRPIELFLNGKYMGVYVLTEKIDGSRQRLDLEVNLKDPGNSPFLVKVEKPARDDPDSDFFLTEEKSGVFYELPKAKKLLELRSKDPATAKRILTHIHGKMARFEHAVRAVEHGNYQSYRSMIEPVSFQDFILLHEVFRNIDGLRRSMFVQYREGRMHMGPVWDFDLALGNLIFLHQMRTYGFQVGHNRYIDGNKEQFWFRTLLKDPNFQRSTVQRYKSLRRSGQPFSTENIMGLIDRMSDELMVPQARNFTIWDPNGKFRDGPLFWMLPRYRHFHYPTVIADLKYWLRARLAWIDNNIENIGLEDDLIEANYELVEMPQ